MSARDEILARRAAVKAAYGADWFAELEAILFRVDPIGINFEHNTDEYAPEVETILPRLAEARDVDDVRRIVHEELVRWFDADLVGPEDRHGALAAEIWAAYQRLRAPR